MSNSWDSLKITVPVHVNRVTNYVLFSDKIHIAYAGIIKESTYLEHTNVGAFEFLTSLPLESYIRVEMKTPFVSTRWFYLNEFNVWYEVAPQNLSKEIKTWLLLMSLEY